MFEAELLRRHRELKTALSTYLWNANPLIIITAPVTYAMIMPFILLDLFVALKVNLGSSARCERPLGSPLGRALAVRPRAAEGHSGIAETAALASGIGQSRARTHKSDFISEAR